MSAKRGVRNASKFSCELHSVSSLILSHAHSPFAWLLTRQHKHTHTRTLNTATAQRNAIQTTCARLWCTRHGLQDVVAQARSYRRRRSFFFARARQGWSFTRRRHIKRWWTRWCCKGWSRGRPWRRARRTRRRSWARWRKGRLQLVVLGAKGVQDRLAKQAQASAYFG